MAYVSESLQSFVTYVQTHLTGDEKGESADFLDHLFRALGHDGSKEAGATRETRLAKKGGAKGKNFAELPSRADILAFLLALNQTCAAREAAGEKITPPGLPLPVEEHEKFTTCDCITCAL